MDNTHTKKPSGDSFSFPSTPTPDSDFEFGSLTPDSPSAEPFASSPADHLFLNGRLQPHPFPLPAASRASSARDSLLSSRSNSTSSSCSSARTSSSDSSERKTFHNKVKGGAIRSTANSSNYQAYGCSQRWQYITPVPAALNRDGSVRRRRDTQQGKKKEEGSKRNNNNNNNNNKKKTNKKKKKKKHKQTVNNKGVRLRFGRRIFRWFLMACRECHAMEPSKSNNKER